jgi:carotenoid cleavage dioxygenase-like enzyme
MKPQAVNPSLEGAFEPWPNEGEIHDLVITGAIPADLRGTYYRNGPNPQYVADERYHVFDGDGMVHAFEFSDRGVRYVNRWVRTEKFALERAAGRGLFGGMRNRGRDPSVADRSGNVANTHVIRHGGRLLALYEAGFPMELDPRTLETKGTWDFHGRLDRAMTAHPKIDPRTGELLFFSYVFGSSRELAYFRADRDGNLIETRKIPVPYPSMMHDFAITENFLLFPVFPLTLDMEKAARGGNPLAWEPGLGTRIGVVPRHGDGETRWLRTDACFAFHFLNAYEDGRGIVLDAVVGDSIPDDAKPFQGAEDDFPTRLIRWRLDPGTGRIGKEVLDDSLCEMPRMDERYCGREYRHGYLVARMDRNRPIGRWDALVHVDLLARTRRVFAVPGRDILNEPVFVPKAGGGEGEGYLLALAYRDAKGRSDLLILDSARIDQGPIAVAHVPHRVPYGFHGSWAGNATFG